MSCEDPDHQYLSSLIYLNSYEYSIDDWKSDIQQIESGDMLVSWLFSEIYSYMDFKVTLSHSTSGLIPGKPAKYTMPTVQPLGPRSNFFFLLTSASFLATSILSWPLSINFLRIKLSSRLTVVRSSHRTLGNV